VNGWITVKAAARLAGRSEATIYAWIKTDRLVTRIGFAGRRLVEGRQVIELEATMRPGRPRKDRTL
jgi:hypothetical protein